MAGWVEPIGLSLAGAATSGVAQPLVVSKVVLRSPGFWEFMGTRNPLEVLRKYLIDRHERKKDNDYRSKAEAETLALEYAARTLGVLERLRRLDQDLGPVTSDLAPLDEALRQQTIAALRPELRNLGELSDRGLIDGSRARTSPEHLPELEPGDESPDSL